MENFLFKFVAILFFKLGKHLQLKIFKLQIIGIFSREFKIWHFHVERRT